MDNIEELKKENVAKEISEVEIKKEEIAVDELEDMDNKDDESPVRINKKRGI